MSNPTVPKKTSIQRSALWQKIAKNLNSVKDSSFIVERDQSGITLLQDLRESGTTRQHNELDAAIEQIIVMEESSDTEQQEMNDENRGKVEADRKKKRRICAKRHFKRWVRPIRGILKKEVLVPEQRRTEKWYWSIGIPERESTARFGT